MTAGTTGRAANWECKHLCASREHTTPAFFVFIVFLGPEAALGLDGCCFVLPQLPLRARRPESREKYVFSLLSRRTVLGQGVVTAPMSVMSYAVFPEGRWCETPREGNIKHLGTEG